MHAADAGSRPGTTPLPASFVGSLLVAAFVAAVAGCAEDGTGCTEIDDVVYCEICDNGRDDDFDGRVDCDDGKCRNDPACRDRASVTDAEASSSATPSTTTLPEEAL